MARVMLKAQNVPTKFWAEAVFTACHISNRVFLRKGTLQTPYELWKGKKPNLSYSHVFGCKCYVLNDRERLGKFNSKSDEGMFLGYSSNSRAYRIFNLRTRRVIESINVVFSDSEKVSEFFQEDDGNGLTLPKEVENRGKAENDPDVHTDLQDVDTSVSPEAKQQTKDRFEMTNKIGKISK